MTDTQESEPKETATGILGFLKRWQNLITAVTALLVAWVNLVNLSISRAPLVTISLTVLALIVAGIIAFRRTAANQRGKRDFLYALPVRCMALIVLLGVPGAIAAAVCLYYAWPSIAGWPSDRVVITVTEFSDFAANNPKDSESPMRCDLGAALADSLDTAARNTGYNIMVQHFHYPVPGLAYTAQWWAHQYAWLTRAQVVIYGHYWPNQSQIIISPKVALTTPIGKKLHVTKNLEGMAIPTLNVAQNEICSTGLANGPLTQQVRPLALLLIGLDSYSKKRYLNAIEALRAAEVAAPKDQSKLLMLN